MDQKFPRIPSDLNIARCGQQLREQVNRPQCGRDRAAFRITHSDGWWGRRELQRWALGSSWTELVDPEPAAVGTQAG